MGTSINCSRCSHQFKPNKGRDAVSMIGGGVTGWVAGGSAGIAALGTATVASGPAAIAGGAVGLAVSSQVARCPECGKVQLK